MILAIIVIGFAGISILSYSLWKLYNKRKSTINAITSSPPSDIVPISFKSGYELTDLPVVTFYQGKQKFHFILDTGCSLSALNPSMLERLQYIETPHTKSYFGVDGSTKKAGIVAVEFSYQQKTYGEYFQVLQSDEAFKNIKKDNGVTITGLLGNSFFEKYKYLIDFSEMIAYSK